MKFADFSFCRWLCSCARKTTKLCSSKFEGFSGTEVLNFFLKSCVFSYLFWIKNRKFQKKKEKRCGNSNSLLSMEWHIGDFIQLRRNRLPFGPLFFCALNVGIGRSNANFPT